MNIIEIKSSTIVTEKDQYIVCNSGIAMSLTLKSAVGSREKFYIKNIGSADVTVTATLPDLIDGAATKTLIQYASCTLLDYKVGVWMVI